MKQRDIYTTEERERVNTGGTGQNNPGRGDPIFRHLGVWTDTQGTRMKREKRRKVWRGKDGQEKKKRENNRRREGRVERRGEKEK